MSSSCAERCNIMRLVDTRWAGIAKGVGVQRIIGRIHMVQIQIEKDYLTTSFSVLEEQPMDMLLGLDMLKRHQVMIVILTLIIYQSERIFLVFNRSQDKCTKDRNNGYRNKVLVGSGTARVRSTQFELRG